MPLRDDLLNPIPGANPSGKNLRWTPDFEKIKEARRRDDTASRGEWKFQLKEADYRAVIKLANEALATKTKDLLIAAWLTEALVQEEGFPGLTSGLDLLYGLVENFWDTVYPEAEDGDVELRAAPLVWVAEFRDMQMAVRNIPLTGNGFDWLKYKESRAVPSEHDAAESEPKAQARRDAVAEGKLIPEEFDAAVSGTPSSYYDEFAAGADAALEAMDSLDRICQEKAGDAAPSFRALRAAVEEVQHTARMLLNKKREAGEVPADTAAPAPAEAETEVPQYYAEPAGYGGAAAAPVRAPAPAQTSLSAEPADREDAIGRVISAARFLRTENPYSPVSFLILRALRWGELRAGGNPPPPELLEAPPTEIRQELRRQSLEGRWDLVLEAAETAMAMPCGRAWLDLQRYSVRACSELGGSYDLIAAALRSELRALLEDVPELPSMTLMDDTPSANAETQDFLAGLAPPGETEEETGGIEPVSSRNGGRTEPQPTASGPDVYEVALQSAQSGRLDDALDILMREADGERTGRGRFHRKVQLAQICIASRKESIAYPILQDLAREIEQRRLEDWEEGNVVAHPLVLLLKCMDRLKIDGGEKQRIYGQICRLDPVQAARLS